MHGREVLLRRLASAVLPGLVGLIEVAALVGWFADRPLLRRFAPGLPDGRPNAIVAVLLLAAAQAVPAHSRTGKLVGTALAGGAGAIAVTTLGEWYLFGDLGVDGILVEVPGPAVAGRMAAQAAATVLVLAVAGIAARWRGPQAWPARTGAVAAVVSGLGALVALGFGAPMVWDAGRFVGMGAPVAVGVLGLGVAQLLGAPRQGLLRLLFATGPGGWLARVLLPGTLVLPVGTGAALAAATSAAVLNPAEAWALMVLSGILLPAASIIIVASALERSEVRRAQIQAEAERARDRQKLLADVSARLASAVDEHQQLTLLARLLVTGGFADACTVCLPDTAGVLRRTVQVAIDPALHATLQAFVGTPTGDDPRTAAWHTGQPVRLTLSDPGRHMRGSDIDPDMVAQLCADAGAGHSIAVPLVARDGPLGVFAAWRPATRAGFDDAELQLLAEVGRRAGQAIDNLRLLAAQRAAAEERGRLVEAERRAQHRLALLSEVSARLAEAAGESEQLVRLADLLTGHAFADRCSIFLPDTTGALVLRVTRTARDTPRAAGDAPTGIRMRDDDPRLAVWQCGHPAAVPYGDGSALAAPLVARGQRIGLCSVVREAAATPFDEHDLRLLADLGHRAGTAIDNLRLLDEQRRIATRLQAALLPTALPAIPGIELAARYLPGERGVDVGGDFYDVFPAGDGYALVIGDVSGRGVDAAGLTGIARTALRALAGHLPPPAVLTRLNALLIERASDSTFLTLAFLLLRPHPGGATVQTWLAGHPPPTVVHADATTTELGIPGHLLGILPEVTHHRHTHELAPGDLLLLHTDGLTEARGPDGLFGRAHLPTHLTRLAGASTTAAVERLAHAVTGYRAATEADDTALLAVRVTAPAGRVLLDQPLRPAGGEAADLGRLLADTLTPLLLPERAAAILAAVAELIAWPPRAPVARPRRPDTDPPRLRIRVTRRGTLRVEVTGRHRAAGPPAGQRRRPGPGLRPPALTDDPATTAGRAADGVWFETGACLLAGTVPVHATVEAALAALAGPDPGPREIRLRLPASPRTVPATRHLLEAACSGWDLPRLTRPAALVLTELVTNAVRHAGTELEIQIADRGEHLCLAVHDHDPTPPVPTDQAGHRDGPLADLPTHGRGLYLVAAYSTAWGCNPTADAKTVWATLSTTPPAPRQPDGPGASHAVVTAALSRSGTPG